MRNNALCAYKAANSTKQSLSSVRGDLTDQILQLVNPRHCFSSTSNPAHIHFSTHRANPDVENQAGEYLEHAVDQLLTLLLIDLWKCQRKLEKRYFLEVDFQRLVFRVWGSNVNKFYLIVINHILKVHIILTSCMAPPCKTDVNPGCECEIVCKTSYQHQFTKQNNKWVDL